MEQNRNRYTLAQVLTGLLYIVSGQRIAIGPVRRANDRKWAETVARNQADLDLEHEAGRSVRHIDGKRQWFQPFSSRPGFKAAPERD